MGLTSEFSVAEGGPTVTIHVAGLSGLETYHVDGVEVHRVKSIFGGTRCFTVPGDPSREVMIEIKTFPAFHARAYVDGELRVPELFPRLQAVDRIANWGLVIGFGLLALVWIFIYAMGT